MNLFRKLFSRPPEDEAVLESESAFSRELFLEKPEHWYLIIYGEFLRTRRDASLASTQAVPALEFLDRVSDPNTKMKSIGSHFGQVTLTSVEVWIADLNRVFRKGSTIDLHKYQKSANEYERIVKDVAYFERLVFGIRTTDKRIEEIKRLLAGTFVESIRPLLNLPDKLLQIQYQGIQSGVFDLDFLPVKNLDKARKLMKKG
jgi:hypothetical protein